MAKSMLKHNVRKHLKTIWKGWGYSVLVALLLATSFKSAIADWNVVPTGSMKPSILEGDRIFVNKLAYDLKVPYSTWHIAEWGSPERGDIVVFYSPVDGQRLVKRVIGLPGDTIAMRNNRLIINGEAIGYDPLPNAGLNKLSMTQRKDQRGFFENLHDARHPVLFTPQRPSLRSFSPIKTPEGNYFMMGDNRDNSADSRYFGVVERSRIVGKASSIVVSFDITHKYQPRWERFFSELQ